VRVAQLHDPQIRLVDADHGQIRIRIIPDELGRGSSSIPQGDMNFVGAMDDVTIGKYETIGGKDKTRPAATGALSLSESRTGWSVVRVTHFNIDNCRADNFGGMDHRLRVGVEQRQFIGRLLGVGCALVRDAVVRCVPITVHYESGNHGVFLVRRRSDVDAPCMIDSPWVTGWQVRTLQ
jgi:hypothetical protein